MLPKIWKKLLLAICIIAVLFNITSKLVNRISLEKTISSTPEGIDVKELFNIVEEEPITEKSTTSTYNVVPDATVDSQTSQVVEDQTNAETQEEASNDSGVTSITDFTTLLY